MEQLAAMSVIPFTIRPMKPADVPTVIMIDRMSFPTPWPPSSYMYELQHPNHSRYYTLLKPAPSTPPPSSLAKEWVQQLRTVLFGREIQKSRVIGYVGFRFQSHPRPHEAHISTIAVHPDWRGRHLGELLFLVAIEEALNLGVQTISLEVRPSNQIAQRLYAKYGFQFTGVNRGYYRDGEDAWLMAVNVSHPAYRSRLGALRQALWSYFQTNEEEGLAPQETVLIP